MKRKTYYFVTTELNGETVNKIFDRKGKAFKFALNSQDKHWLILRLTLLGTGGRKGLTKRARKKSKRTYYYYESKICTGNVKGDALEVLGLW